MSESAPPPKTAGLDTETLARDYEQALEETAEDSPQDVRHCLKLIERVRKHDSGPVPDNRRVERRATAGDRIGRFEIKRTLGEGGYGVVFLAFDPQLNRPVALKVPGPGVMIQTELLQRFHREAEAGAALDHPHIVSVYEAGAIGTVHYISSAYISGESLADWLSRRSEPIEAKAAARLIRVLALAVQHAHSRGVLHRDIKPANILLQTDHSEVPADQLADAARLADFGLAKVMGGETTTQTQAILGTPAYMAPEQAEGRTRDVGTCSDIFALGIVLYELLTGRPPFLRDTQMATLKAIGGEEPTRPSKFNPRIPEDLEAICLKCLEKPIDRRYPAVGALADDLDRFLCGNSVTARTIGRGERFLRWCRNNPGIALLSGLSAITTLALIVGLAAAYWMVSDAHQETRSHLSAAENAKKEADRNARKAQNSEYRSIVAQIQLGRQSGRPGRRLAALRAIRRGVELIDELQLGDMERTRLRDEAISCLSLCDAEQKSVWPGISGRVLFDVDASAKRYAHVSQETVFVRRASDHSMLSKFSSSHGIIKGMRLNPAGDQLAIRSFDRAGTGRLEIVDVDDSERLFQTEITVTEEFDFSPSGRRLFLLRRSGQCEVFDTGDFKKVKSFRAATGPASKLRAGPIGSRIAYVAYDRRTRRHLLKVIDIATTRTVSGVPLTEKSALDAQWSPDGRRIAIATRSGKVEIWSLKTRQRIGTLPSENARLYSLGWHPGGRFLAAVGTDGQTRIFDVELNQIELTIEGRFHRFDRSGDQLVGMSGRVRFAAPEVYRAVHRPAEMNAQLHLSADHLLWTGTRGGWLAYDLSKMTLVAEHRIRGLNALAVAPDGKAAFVALNGGLKRYGVVRSKQGAKTTLQLEQPTPVTEGHFYHLVAAKDRLIAVETANKTVGSRVVSIEIDTGRKQVLGEVIGGLSHVAIDEKAERIAVLSLVKRVIEVRRAATGELIRRIQADPSWRCLAFHPGGRQLIIAGYSGWTIRDVENGTEIASYSPENPLRFDSAVAWSPDGRWLACASAADRIQLLDAITRKPLATLPIPAAGGIGELHFSPDSKTLLVSAIRGKGPVHVWRLAELRRRLKSLDLGWPDAEPDTR